MKRSESLSKSLTPQRKHRKLLKDGSGTEVWPESIEKIFVQGLKEYWESPYATYSQSRGRSRWRNQFLVDYLQRAGITRSKKQVASHIQVLRNMWKGEPEFHLVAGGEELLSDAQGGGSVKMEEHWDSNGLIPFDYEENDIPSPNSASPDFSPPDIMSDFPPTPEHRPNLHPSDITTTAYNLSSSLPAKLHYSPTVAHGMDLDYTSPHFTNAYQRPGPPYSDPHRVLPLPPVNYPNTKPTSMGLQPSVVFPDVRRVPAVPNSHISYPSAPSRSVNTASYYSNPSPARLTSLCVSAEGMSPLSIKIDDVIMASTLSSYSPLTLRIKLSIPTINDPRTSPMFEGFIASACLSSVWIASGKCVTRVFANQLCVTEETGLLDVSHIDVGTVNVLIPESNLSRCRWSDISLITQDIIVDDCVLLHVVYELDRNVNTPFPSALLLSVQKYRPSEKMSARHLTMSATPSLTQQGVHYLSSMELNAGNIPYGSSSARSTSY
ncbi:hypothetical protein BDQ17DRAFT_1389883 [Cyathus striatus]|nr:hypothetical protein BDQ17DRAFT_1389883 [Cyathus striatus]